MLKKHNQIFKDLFILSDILFILFSWVFALFLVAFEKPPDLQGHLQNAIFILPVCIVVFHWFGLYRPMRTTKEEEETFGVIKAVSLSLLLAVTLFYFLRQIYFPSLFFIYFWLLSILFVVSSRAAIRAILRQLRKKGFNLRHILIVGTGELGQRIAKQIKEHSEFGLNIVGFISGQSKEVGKSIQDDIPVLGEYRDLTQITKKYPIDQIILALPVKEERVIRAILGMVDRETADIKVVLDLSRFSILRKSVDELEDLLIINMRESPLYGWNSICKRLFDIIISLSVLIICSPLLFFVALLIKLTSKGPAFYRQKRISLNGKPFELTKFRTMVANAEESCGPVWAKESDNRKTWIGKILRRLSLDELPQFLNVLNGNMSIVGPRPERQVFVEQFSKSVPKYMLRHVIKSGVTGWAQIHGWRGNTSIEKRIEYDLYYIENWSFWLDIKIILLTIPAVLRGRGAY